MAGIDRALAKTKFKDFGNMADAFDFTWLTAVIIRLDRDSGQFFKMIEGGDVGRVCGICLTSYNASN